MAKFLRFEIPNEDWFLVFGVSNAKYLAFDTPDDSALRGYFSQFLGFEIILVIFSFRGYFIHFLGLGGIMVIFRFRGYSGHFLGLEGILVIF